MQKRNAAACFVALAGIAASGCGTTINVAMQPGGMSVPPVYGGVQTDTRAAAWLFTGGPFAEGKNALTRGIMDVGGVCAALDLPLSAVADTLTLPYTLWLQFGPHDGANDKQESSAVTPTAVPRPTS